MTAGAPVRLRVTVTDAWDSVALEAAPDLTLAEIKRRALVTATGRALDPTQYLVKYRGGLVLDEDATVAGLGLPDGAPLIVLPRQRRPVW